MKSIRSFLLIGLVIITFFSCNKSAPSPATTGDWARESPMVMLSRTEAVSFVINNTAYVGTGWDGLITNYNDFWKYDAVNDSWTQVASMPEGTERHSAVAFSVNGKGYVGTGFDEKNNLKDFYRYDPATDSWSQIASLAGSPRLEAVAFGIGNLGYVGTGLGEYGALKDFYQYDPSSDSWTSIDFNGNARWGAVSWVYEDRAYLVTGVNSAVFQTDFWVFDPKSDTSKWTRLHPITDTTGFTFDKAHATIARWNASAAVVGNKVILSMGGSGRSTTNPQINFDPYINSHSWIYQMNNPGEEGNQTNVWTEATAFEGPPTWGAVSFSLTSTTGGGGFFLIPGTPSWKPGTYYSQLWQFFPDTPPNPNDN